MSSANRFFLFGAESPKTSILAEILKQVSNSEVMGYSSHRSAKFFHSNFLDSVEFAEPNDDLLNRFISGSEFSNALCIPMTSEWARFFARSKLDWSNSRVLQGASNYFIQLDDKKLFKTLLDREFKRPKMYEDDEFNAQRVVIKPRRLQGSKGISYMSSSDIFSIDHLALEMGHDDFIIEEFILGEGVCIGGICLDGEVLFSASHLRLLEWPLSGGASSVRKTFFSLELDSAISQVAKKTNWTGFLMLEAKITGEGEIYFIEANPRPWGGLKNFTLTLGESSWTEIFGSFFPPFTQPMPRQLKSKLSVNTYSSPLFHISFMRLMFKDPYRLWKLIFMKKTADVSFFRDSGGWLAQFIPK